MISRIALPYSRDSYRAAISSFATINWTRVDETKIAAIVEESKENLAKISEPVVKKFDPISDEIEFDDFAKVLSKLLINETS
jgi:hypothetical protein